MAKAVDDDDDDDDDDDELIDLYGIVTWKKCRDGGLQGKKEKRCIFKLFKCFETIYKSDFCRHCSTQLIQLRQTLAPRIVFDVHFSSTSLPAVDAEVEVNTDDDLRVECLSVWLAEMHNCEMLAEVVPLCNA